MPYPAPEPLIILISLAVQFCDQASRRLEKTRVTWTAWVIYNDLSLIENEASNGPTAITIMRRYKRSTIRMMPFYSKD